MFQTDRMDAVTLNVGGTSFSSLRSTLTSEPLSLLAKMVTAQSPQPPPSPCLECCASDMMQNTMSGACPHRATSDGGSVIQVDCDPAAFSVVLNCLRHGVIAIPPYLPVQLIKAAAASLGLTQVERKLEDFERKGTSKKEWLKLNVGGRIFETTRATLASHPSSSLAKMFEPRPALPPTLMEDGVYQVNLGPLSFDIVTGHTLKHLPNGCIHCTSEKVWTTRWMLALVPLPSSSTGCATGSSCLATLEQRR